MNRNSRSLATLGMTAATLGMTLALCVIATPARAQDVGLELGSQAPAAQVETLDGAPANLSQYVGKTPVLMEFWATWCENCHELEPTVKAMYAKYGTRVTQNSRSEEHTS